MKFVYGNNYQIYFLVILDNHSRVILSGDEKTDYINASFIDVGSNMHGEEYCVVHMKVFQQFCLTIYNFL
jgi:protein tyrosine phosphatase